MFFDFMKKRHLAPVMAGAASIAAAAVLWSLDGAFLRPQLFSLPTTQVVFFEHVFGALFLAPFLFMYRTHIKNMPLSAWKGIFFVALLGGVAGTLFFTQALFVSHFKNIAALILLQKLQPVFAVLLAVILLKERFNYTVYLWGAIALVAGYFTTFAHPLTPWYALVQTSGHAALFALFAAMSWGAATTVGKYTSRFMPPTLMTVLRFVFTALLLAPVMAFSFFSHTIQHTSLAQWSILVLIALSTGVAAMLLYYFGLKKTPATIATFAELAWPVSAIFFDYWAHGNILAFSQLIAAVILFFAVTFMMRSLSLPHVQTAIQ